MRWKTKDTKSYEGLHTLYSSPNIIRIKWKKICCYVN